MPRHLIDVHAHLTDEKLAGDVPSIIERAAAAGVHTILTVGTDLPTSRAALDLARRFPDIWAAVGVHPHDANGWNDGSAAELEGLLADDRVVALGEMGLDYHYDFSPRAVQRRVFQTQWELATRLQVTAVVHIREAFDDFFALAASSPPPPRVLLHCFSGTLDQARKALDLGFEFSVGGPLTYPKNQETRTIFGFLPADRIHLETDCPYLAPQPRRGKANEPAFLALTAEGLAKTRGLPIDTLADTLLANARRLFPKMRV